MRTKRALMIGKNPGTTLLVLFLAYSVGVNLPGSVFLYVKCNLETLSAQDFTCCTPSLSRCSCVAFFT